MAIWYGSCTTILEKLSRRFIRLTKLWYGGPTKNRLWTRAGSPWNQRVHGHQNGLGSRGELKQLHGLSYVLSTVRSSDNINPDRVPAEKLYRQTPASVPPRRLQGSLERRRCTRYSALPDSTNKSSNKSKGRSLLAS